MTTEFQNKIASVLSWALITLAALDVIMDTTKLLSGIIMPIVINYFMGITAFLLLLFGIYSLLYQKHFNCKFKYSTLLVVVGTVFTVINIATPINGLYFLGKVEQMVAPEQPPEILLAISANKMYLINLSTAYVVLLIVFIFIIRRSLSLPNVGPPPNQPLKRDEETAGVSE